MMDKGTEEQASCYVLGILEPEEAAQFERDLAASEELRLEVARLRDSLHAGFREGARPVQPPESVHAGLRQRLKGSAARRRVVWTWARGWAAAALLLFGLQLYQMQRPSQERVSADDAPLAASVAVQPQRAALLETTAEPAVVLRSRIEQLEEALRTRDAELGEKAQELERIEQGMRSLANESATVREAYSRLAARIFPFFDGTEGLSRFTVIEMVDGRAQAGVPARRPFANLAEQFLTGFNRQQADTAAPMGPFPEGMDSARLGDPDGLLAASLSEMGLARFHETSAAAAGDGTVELFDGDSTGFTVWRDDEQKGFLDVYNLPEAGAGRQAYLWVRASELESYLPVGTLPQLENGSGSVFYTIDEPDFSPVEVLITAEPEDGPGAQPDPGHILLRGP